ncbi:10897_t:CDS:1, partial [Racocetra fulgida]
DSVSICNSSVYEESNSSSVQKVYDTSFHKEVYDSSIREKIINSDESYLLGNFKQAKEILKNLDQKNKGRITSLASEVMKLRQQVTDQEQEILDLK